MAPSPFDPTVTEFHLRRMTALSSVPGGRREGRTVLDEDQFTAVLRWFGTKHRGMIDASWSCVDGLLDAKGEAMSKEQMLKGHDLFQSLTPDEVDRISRFTSVRKCQAGDVIFRAGDTATHLYIVVEGRVNLLLPSTRSDVGLVMTRAEQGDLFGLSPLLGSTTYTLSAQCSQATEILSVETKPLRELLLAKPIVGFDVMTSVSRTYFERYVELSKRLQGIVAQLPLIP